MRIVSEKIDVKQYCSIA